MTHRRGHEREERGARSLALRLALLAGLVALAIGPVRYASDRWSAPEDVGADTITWSDLVPGGGSGPTGVVAHGGTSTPLNGGEAAIAALARADLDGRRVALAGYMTPLRVEGRRTRMFLLVPYVGACVHVPAPPPNQIVLVESTDEVGVRPMWEPFTAIGTLTVEQLDTGLAEVAYTMQLERIVSHDAEETAAAAEPSVVRR